MPPQSCLPLCPFLIHFSIHPYCFSLLLSLPPYLFPSSRPLPPSRHLLKTATQIHSVPPVCFASPPGFRETHHHLLRVARFVCSVYLCSLCNSRFSLPFYYSTSSFISSLSFHSHFITFLLSHFQYPVPSLLSIPHFLVSSFAFGPVSFPTIPCLGPSTRQRGLLVLVVVVMASASPRETHNRPGSHHHLHRHHHHHYPYHLPPHTWTFQN